VLNIVNRILLGVMPGAWIPMSGAQSAIDLNSTKCRCRW
jgi:hypothetical protein